MGEDRRAGSMLLGLMLLLAFGAFLWAVAAKGLGWGDLTWVLTARNGVIVDGDHYAVPAPEGDGSRLASAVDVEPGGSYEMWYLDSEGLPILYDPCEPLRWVYNPEGEPYGGADIVASAVQEVADATGLQFVYEGLTNEVLEEERKAIQPLYGTDRFAPVVIGWSDEETLEDLAGTVVGIGGSSVVPAARGDHEFLAAGSVVIDSDDARDLLGTFEGDDVVRAVVMHELGHVVGLSHVDDSGELMSPSNRWQTEWGPGDRTGLALAGQGACQS